MALEQSMLLQRSLLYQRGAAAVNPRQRRVLIIHNSESFRLVEGFLVLMSQAALDSYWDWDSGDYTDKQRRIRRDNLANRVASAQFVIVLVTEGCSENEVCLKALEYAKAINKRVYLVETSCDNHVYSLESPKDGYSVMSFVLPLRGSVKPVVRVRNPKRTQLWRSITHISQL